VVLVNILKNNQMELQSQLIDFIEYLTQNKSGYHQGQLRKDMKDYMEARKPVIIHENRKIAIFYHIAVMNHWMDINEIITVKLVASGLVKSADIFIKNSCMDIELFEFPTLEILREFAHNNPDYNILYLHTKGVSHNPGKQCIRDWLDCMLYWLVENWRECIEKLNEYDTVGINYMLSPLPHYQGNFWWATAKYINTLGPVRDIQDLKPKGQQFDERHKCEMWLLSNPSVRSFQMYHHCIDPYNITNPRKNYVRNTN
jgi:hypothetical protein